MTLKGEKDRENERESQIMPLGEHSMNTHTVSWLRVLSGLRERHTREKERKRARERLRWVSKTNKNYARRMQTQKRNAQ